MRFVRNGIRLGGWFVVDVVYEPFPLTVWDSNSVPVFCARQKDIEKVPVMPGKYTMTVRAKSLSLNSGIYSVSAGAVSSRNEVAEWIDKAQHFEVHTTFSSGAPYDGRLGYVNQDVAWGVPLRMTSLHRSTSRPSVSLKVTGND